MFGFWEGFTEKMMFELNFEERMMVSLVKRGVGKIFYVIKV